MLPHDLFFRELVILNGHEGSQNRVNKRYFALLSMTNNFWANIHIIAIIYHPTAPSSDTLSNFCASTANSMGSLLSTSRA